LKSTAGQNAFVPTGGCPGPEVVDVAARAAGGAEYGPGLPTPHDRPRQPDTDCKTLTKEEFREQLQDILDDTKGKNVLLMGHHPVLSNGQYGGPQPLSRHLLPRWWHPLRGLPPKRGHPARCRLARLLGAAPGAAQHPAKHPGVVYAASHDYSLQLTPFQGNYHLVSGSNCESQHVGANGQSLYNESQQGYPSWSTTPMAR
jgi:hypothetical protein